MEKFLLGVECRMAAVFLFCFNLCVGEFVCLCMCLGGLGGDGEGGGALGGVGGVGDGMVWFDRKVL